MICLINNIRQHERYFWNCLHSVASEYQIQQILSGKKLNIADSEYQIIDDESELNS